MADDPREHTPEEIEALRQRMAETQRMLREQAAPMVAAARKVLDSQSAQIGGAMRRLADVQTSPAFEAARQAVERVSNIELHAVDAISEGIDRIKPEPMIPLEVPKPREFYIVDALYDAVDAIEGTGGLLKDTLEVQNRQAQEIGEIRKGMDHQTTLNRWVLGVAAATLVASVSGVVISVLVALSVI